VLLLACLATAVAVEEPIILKVWQLPDPRSSDAFGLAQMAAVDAFRQRYPHVELRSFSGIEIENMGMDSKPLMAIAGGVAPDILYVNFRQSDTYIQNNFLLPLDDYMAGLSEEELAFRIPKPAWPVVRREGPGGEEHVWCMPYVSAIRVLVYRKDLFNKAGLDSQHPPADWDELLEYSRRLTDPSEGTYGMILNAGPHAAWDWITYLWSAGGEAVVRDENGQWKAAFNGTAAVDAMEMYCRLLTTRWRDAEGKEHIGYAIREGGARASKLWADGKIGMRMTSMRADDLGRGLDPNLYGLAPVPVSWNGTSASELNCGMMGIFAQAGEKNNSGLGDRDPVRVRQAAWDYIWFMDSEEARAIRTRVLVDAGYAKFQNPVYLKRYGYEEYLKYVDPRILDTYEEALENGKPEPYGRNCQRVYEFMSFPMEECLALSKAQALGNTREEQRARMGEIFDKAVDRTNKDMIGYISLEERTRRNRVALFVATFIAIAFFFVIRKVWLIFTPEDDPTQQGWLVRKYFFAYLLLVPALGSILLWKYVPMIMGSIIAFQDFQIVGQSTWIGLQNFADVLHDPMWWKAIGKTLYYMALMLTIGFVPPIILAILLQEVSHGKLFYRVIFYLPAVITGIIVVYLWKLLYDPSEAGGLNQILMALGFEKKAWLNDERLAMLCCVIPTVWAGMGPGCLIYLAALKGIPDDSYEAADLDGATFLQKIRHVVFPNLKALVIIQFINAFIAASQQSGFILVMTFGGPNEATKVAGLMIFEKAYLSLKFGVATTMAWMLGVMLMGFTVLQLRRLSNMEFKARGAEI